MRRYNMLKGTLSEIDKLLDEIEELLEEEQNI